MWWKSFSFVGFKFFFWTNKNWLVQKILLVFDKTECFVEIPPESEQNMYISAVHWTYTFGRSSKWVFTKYKILRKKFENRIVTFWTEYLEPCEFVFAIKSFHAFDQNIFPILFSFFHPGPYLRSVVIYPSLPKSENIVDIWDERVEQET